MPYNSVTEHPGPLKVSMVSTLIFALVSKSVDRISKFALIKKLGKKIKNFRLGCQGVRKIYLEKNYKNVKKIANFFIKANFEILTTDLDTRPKISVLTFESLSGAGCSVSDFYGFFKFNFLKSVIL